MKINWLKHCRDKISGCMVYVTYTDQLTVLVSDLESREYKETGRWHLSISHPTRYPTWDEISDARYSLIPDNVTMMMYLPPKDEYVNIHNNCFHLYESREKF